MQSIIGGILIGSAVSLMLLFNGRVTGISGIVGGMIKLGATDRGWRFMFILGLLLGGILLRFFEPSVFIFESRATSVDYVFAGFLVGTGTLLAGGCTSGHGVCGISRLSLRSLIATITFILSGFISVLIFKTLRGGL